MLDYLALLHRQHLQPSQFHHSQVYSAQPRSNLLLQLSLNSQYRHLLVSSVESYLQHHSQLLLHHNQLLLHHNHNNLLNLLNLHFQASLLEFLSHNNHRNHSSHPLSQPNHRWDRPQLLLTFLKPSTSSHPNHSHNQPNNLFNNKSRNQHYHHQNLHQFCLPSVFLRQQMSRVLLLLLLLLLQQKKSNQMLPKWILFLFHSQNFLAQRQAMVHKLLFPVKIPSNASSTTLNHTQQSLFQLEITQKKSQSSNQSF
ncbi:hypothetical protein TRFO_09564 [Tritrichomonas foetus]|uniref:Uncharacterized protein n=1 Tax=Tritrichomonas foetus TaxID=1144522 RepID=A0A1J4JDV1_9EUKA|nr:hypothetical protein TRFO_09564 [Tritrichomonas foetus]|eukprot:OHS97280.1 hypothetical protein TRFO_09564 [Tritrichomonas foetus]